MNLSLSLRTNVENWAFLSVLGRWRYVRQADGLYDHLYDVVSDPFEFHDRIRDAPDVLDCLRETVLQFRQNQLGYYQRPDMVRSFFPPSDRLAIAPTCK